MASRPILRKLHCIAAMDSTRGIGKNGDLPWKLPKELQTFHNITTAVKCEGKQNAVIMGRLTYFSNPEHLRPFKDRLNVILSKTLTPEDVPADVLISRSLEECVELLSCEPYCDTIENLFVIGGSNVYDTAMSSGFCERIYLTEVYGEFDCDTFYPVFDKDMFREITPEGLCQDIQEENGIQYKFHVYSSSE